MLITDHCLECDTCHKRTEFYLDLAALKTAAVALGWKRFETKDHCPECVPNINPSKNKAGNGEGNSVILNESGRVEARSPTLTKSAT